MPSKPVTVSLARGEHSTPGYDFILVDRDENRMKIILFENDKTLTFCHFTKKQALRDGHNTINQDVLLKIRMAGLAMFLVDRKIVCVFLATEGMTDWVDISLAHSDNFNTIFPIWHNDGHGADQ